MKVKNPAWKGAAAGLLLTGVCVAGEQRLFDEGVQAMQDGIPQVAIQKLQSYLAKEPEAQKRAEAMLKIAESLLADDQPEEAVKNLPQLRNTPSDLVRAKALGKLGRWSEALEILHSNDQKENAEVWMLQAEALKALGRRAEAIAALESLGDRLTPMAQLQLADLYLSEGQNEKCRKLLDSLMPVTTRQELLKQYAQGRLLLALGDNQAALIQFEALLKDARNTSARLQAGASFGIAEARLEQEGAEAADDVVEAFISENPASPYLADAFVFLDSLYALEEMAPVSALEKWFAEKEGERAVQARFYLAKANLREQKTERAQKLLREFLEAYPSHSLTPEAGLLLGELLTARGEYEQAHQSLETAMRSASNPGVLARIEMAVGAAYFLQREFVLANTHFVSARNHSSKVWEEAIFCSALAWLYQGNYEKFLSDYKELSVRIPKSTFCSELILEEGLQQARTGDQRARETLESFLRDFPGHARRPDALLALAEMAFLDPDHAGNSGSDYLRVANEFPQSPDTAEHIAYLQFNQAEKPGAADQRQALTLGRKFLETYPQSKLAPEVRMKMAQIHFKAEDYANAETEFTLLANEDPASELRETALFLAGQSALHSMSSGAAERALDLFEETAKLNGPLRLNALEAQAVVQLRLGKEQEAVTIYESILQSQPDSELRASAMSGMADVFFGLGEKAPQMLEKAAAVYRDVAALPEVRAQWQNQALYKLGKCLEKKGKQTEALTTFYDVLNKRVASQEPEYFWFYKAGFAAARLLEDQSQWNAAVGVYQKLASLQGPRSEEAKERIKQLRLEHFLWEE